MKKLILLPFILIFLISCTTTYKLVEKASREDIKNIEISKESTRNFLSTWEFRSGRLKGYLQADAEKFSYELRNIVRQLDELAAKENLTDSQLGDAKGMFMKFIVKGSKEVWEIYGIKLTDILGL